ncbi:hypothetical protein [Azohydromonas lata]|uniref:Transposase n=1 Tax=Azohydromonas lata TaxID=45677 RepID=A0ABU5IHA3_9BURK|nr:hypothetical protein [Azohydromonas lata]MDZ5457896.1 hypothetical protein [Azohydromonas lata]
MAQSPKTAHVGGNMRTPAQSSTYVPAHYLRRVARSILLRAAVKGRLSWVVVLHLLALLDRGGEQ